MYLFFSTNPVLTNYIYCPTVLIHYMLNTNYSTIIELILPQSVFSLTQHIIYSINKSPLQFCVTKAQLKRIHG